MLEIMNRLHIDFLGKVIENLRGGGGGGGGGGGVSICLVNHSLLS